MITAAARPAAKAAAVPTRSKLTSLPTYFILVLVAGMLLVPIIWLLITSLKQNTEYLSYPIKFLPAVPRWDNYAQVFAPAYDFLEHTWMTLFLAIMFSSLTVMSSSLCGYAFARYRDVRANSRLFTLIVAMIIIPSIVTVIPSFMIFAKVKLTGTYWPWVFWGLAGSPYHIFLFRQFFLTFPKELEDAAEVDGCTAFGTFWRIFLPNAKAPLATSFILNFLAVWGDWITPRIFLKNSNTTVGVLVNTIFTNPQGQLLTTLTITGIVLYTLPVVIIFFLGQRYILKGVVTSGLAGR